jgi:hypothetical protein
VKSFTTNNCFCPAKSKVFAKLTKVFVLGVSNAKSSRTIKFPSFILVANADLKANFLTFLFTFLT